MLGRECFDTSFSGTAGTPLEYGDEMPFISGERGGARVGGGGDDEPGEAGNVLVKMKREGEKKRAKCNLGRRGQ